MSINIREITSAWWDSYFGTDNQKSLAKKRLEVCENCPSLEQKFKKLRKITVTVCGECGCPIAKKIFSPKFNACPLGKWKNVDELYLDVFENKKNNLL